MPHNLLSLTCLFILFIEFETHPENVMVCDAQSLPQLFNFSCTYLSPVLPGWIVTGLDGVADQVLSLTESVGSLSYTMGSPSMDSVAGVSTLIVDRSEGMGVTVGTCFRCQIATIPPTASAQACVEETRELQ